MSYNFSCTIDAYKIISWATHWKICIAYSFGALALSQNSTLILHKPTTTYRISEARIFSCSKKWVPSLAVLRDSWDEMWGNGVVVAWQVSGAVTSAVQGSLCHTALCWHSTLCRQLFGLLLGLFSVCATGCITLRNFYHFVQ